MTLDEHGVLDYDQQLKDVSTTDRTEAMTQIIQTIENAVENANSDMSTPPDLGH